MKRTSLVLLSLVMALPAHAASITWRGPSIGDYRIINVKDIEGSDGHIYRVNPLEMTYEEFQRHHHFFHPRDVIQSFIAAVHDAQIPLEDVRRHPDVMYMIEEPWTERYDALYEVPFLTQCGSGCDPSQQTTLSIGSIEYNTLGASFGDSWAIPYNFIVVRREVFGDLNQNGFLDIADIDLLTMETANGAYRRDWDFNEDWEINGLDIEIWIEDIFGTLYGDVDLDGLFNSSDLIAVLSKGKYGSDRHAVWSDGDFTGDGWVDSSDFIIALAKGGYEATATEAKAIPEPSGVVLLMIGCICLWRGFVSSISN